MPEEKISILVVDDSEASRYATARMLRAHNFDVIEAATGEKGLELAQQLPDLVILDVNLPDKNGFEVCSELKTGASNHYIPVMHLSAVYADSSSRVYGLNRGADGYLVLPVEELELVATVNALLRMKKAEEQVRQTLREKEDIIRQLEDAAAKIRVLSGLLPVCMHCKQIRNDNGYWQQMEAYITTHADVLFSHSVCPGCMEKHYPDLAD